MGYQRRVHGENNDDKNRESLKINEILITDDNDVVISNATVNLENDNDNNNNRESLKLNDILVAVDNSKRNLLSNGTVQYEDQPKLSEFESNATVQYRASLNINEILVDGVDNNDATKNELK